MNKIILTGVRNIKTDETIEANKDYGIFLVASRLSEEKMDTFSDEEKDEVKYKLKVSHIDSITDLKEHKELKFKDGQTPSQKWRYIVECELGEYENFMAWQMAHATEIFEMYREDIND